MWRRLEIALDCILLAMCFCHAIHSDSFSTAAPWIIVAITLTRVLYLSRLSDENARSHIAR